TPGPCPRITSIRTRPQDHHRDGRHDEQVAEAPEDRVEGVPLCERESREVCGLLGEISEGLVGPMGGLTKSQGPKDRPRRTVSSVSRVTQAVFDSLDHLLHRRKVNRRDTRLWTERGTDALARRSPLSRRHRINTEAHDIVESSEHLLQLGK